MLSPMSKDPTFKWRRYPGTPLKIHTYGTVKIFAIGPRSRRIQTRTKGKRRMKRLAKEAAARMRALILKTEWEMFHRTARGEYP